MPIDPSDTPPADPLITPHKPGQAPPSAPSRADARRALPPPPRRSPFGGRSLRRWLAGMLVLTAVAVTVVLLLNRRGPPADFSLSEDGFIELPDPKHFPEQDTLRASDEGTWITRYRPDTALQSRLTAHVSRLRPDAGVVVVSDLRTGQILALVERDSGGTATRPQMALNDGSFPAASLAKIITAAAAIEEGLCGPSGSIPLIGGQYTLNRSQLRTPEKGRYRTVTLRDAFGRSVNPSFGILGLQLGAAPLRSMGQRLGFSEAQFPVPDTGFGLAQVACGYTKNTTISPIQALQIARAIGSDGRVIPVRFTRELQSLETGRIWRLPEPEAEPFTSDTTLRDLRTLMEATVLSGTARGGFRRNLTPVELRRLELGGKTGSLNGLNPPGRYEWFVGYARHRDRPGEGIAVSVMMIHQARMAVRATDMAGMVVRDWLRHGGAFEEEEAVAGS